MKQSAEMMNEELKKSRETCEEGLKQREVEKNRLKQEIIEQTKMTEHFEKKVEEMAIRVNELEREVSSKE